MAGIKNSSFVLLFTQNNKQRKKNFTAKVQSFFFYLHQFFYTFTPKNYFYGKENIKREKKRNKSMRYRLNSSF